MSAISGFRPISIMSVLSKVYERLVSSRLCDIMESENVFPIHQFEYRMRLETCGVLLDIVCAGEDALDWRRE